MQQRFNTDLEKMISLTDVEDRCLLVGSQKVDWEVPEDAWIRKVTSMLYHVAYTTGAKPEKSRNNDVKTHIPIPGYEKITALRSDQIILDSGWELDRKSNMNEVRISKGNITTTAGSGYYLWEEGTRDANMISTIDKSVQENPGDVFTYLFGSEPQHLGHGDTVRFYLNSDCDNVVELVLALRALLNEHSVPFTLKFIRYADQFDHRKDNIVLYTGRQYANRVAILLSKKNQPWHDLLQSDLPLFLLQLLPGIGFGESPPNPQDSFGVSRCRVIAMKLYDLVNGGVKYNEWNERICQALIQYRFDLDRFYLNPNCAYHYTFIEN